MQNTEEVLQAGRELTDSQIGVFQSISVSSSIPDEPAMYLASIHRSHPDQLTDGVFVEPNEGGCSLEASEAAVSAIGEGVERYSACLYRKENLITATYADLDNALNPEQIINFSPIQKDKKGIPTPLYNQGDEICWVETTRHVDGSVAYVPAQLVYLSYDASNEPFIRAPISTGLAAGLDTAFAIQRGILELVERDAFMIYYLTMTELPQIRTERNGVIGAILDRLDRAGLDYYLLDARTDLEIPVVIAVLSDPEGEPTVSVAAAARATTVDAIRAALEEALQTRFYQRHRLEEGESAVDLEKIPHKKIGRDTRLLGWAHGNAAGRLQFWTESDREITLSQIQSENNIKNTRQIQAHVGSQWELYIANLTTSDIAQVGFTVVRVIAPSAQPLYLRESNRYWDETRLSKVPTACGFNPAAPSDVGLNDYPHPFP